MSPKKILDSRHTSIDTCALQLHSWRPFLDSSTNGAHHNYTLTKRPCLSDRATSFSLDSIDLSKLSLLDDDRATTSLKLIARKRRRQGSRSVSGRSSDRSGTRRCCSMGAASAAAGCSDFPVAVGTDSSGELFGNGDANWASDVSEAKNNCSSRRGEREREREERENNCLGGGQFGNIEAAQGNESGYGSESGYRGDDESGYGDEVDEEEEDARLLFWGDYYADTDPKLEMVGENTFSDQKVHYRRRRKKHDCRVV